MLAEAIEYLASRNIVRKEPLYSANRFVRVLGDVPAEQVETAHFDRLRKELVAAGLKSRTIESTVSDVMTVVKSVTGRLPDKGRRLAVLAPCPMAVSTDSIDRIWRHLEPWMQSWLAVAYWTGLRLSDCMRWLKDHRDDCRGERIVVVASKTGKRHAIPYPDWLRAIVTSGPYRFRTVSDCARRGIRSRLANACAIAEMNRIQPKQIRQTSVTEWCRASSTAGEIIHGCGLARGVMAHYLDSDSILEAAAGRVRVPVSFGRVTASIEDHMLQTFRRLDRDAQEIVSKTAERFAAG